MMQNVKLRLSNFRYNAAQQRYQARAEVHGTASLTLTCAVDAPRDANLKQVVKQLSSEALRAYKASLPKPSAPLTAAQMRSPQPEPKLTRLH